MHCATTAQARKWFAEITVHVSNMENGLTHLYRKTESAFGFRSGVVKAFVYGERKKNTLCGGYILKTAITLENYTTVTLLI